MTLTGKEIVSAIAENIRKEFEDTEILAIYKDTPVQNITKPCMFINIVTSVQTPEMNKRAHRNYMLDIIVTGADDNTELYTWFSGISERLFSCIDRITISNQMVKASRLESSIQDNELHVMATYNFKVVKQETDSTENIKMQTNTIYERVE